MNDSSSMASALESAENWVELMHLLLLNEKLEIFVTINSCEIWLIDWGIKISVILSLHPMTFADLPLQLIE